MVGLLAKVVVSFLLLLAQKKKQEKGTPPLVPPKAGYPVLLDAAGALQTRCAQTVQIPFSAASAVLGCVPMVFFWVTCHCICENLPEFAVKHG